MSTTEPTLPDPLLGSIPWAILIFLATILFTYLVGCFVLEITTEIVVDDRKRKCEQTNRRLSFRKGPVKFKIGSYHTGHLIEEVSDSALGDETVKEEGE